MGFAEPDPGRSPEKRAKGDLTHSVAIIDACRPWSWRDKDFLPANTPSAGLTWRRREANLPAGC